MQLLRIDWNVVFTIINLIVLYLALRKFLIKPVTNIMEQRKQMIEGDIADARKEKDKAYDLKAQYEDKLTQAHKESSEIIEKARKSAQTEYNNKVSVASAEADRIIKDAHKAVELDRVQDLQSEIAGLAVAAAEKVLGESGTKESNQLMYDQFLAKAGGVNDTDSE